MQFPTLSSAALLSLLSLASAEIYGLALPSTITQHDRFNVTLLTDIGSQPSLDKLVVLGVYPAPGLEGSLGNIIITSQVIGALHSNINKPIVFGTSLPDNFPKTNGVYTITGTVFTLLGSYNTPSLNTFTQNITVTGWK